MLGICFGYSLTGKELHNIYAGMKLYCVTFRDGRDDFVKADSYQQDGDRCVFSRNDDSKEVQFLLIGVVAVVLVAVLATAPLAVVEKMNAHDHTVETTSVPQELAFDYNRGGGSSSGLDWDSGSGSV
jgi:hypothetical protein